MELTIFSGSEQYAPLCNSYQSTFVYKGKEYSSVEQAIQSLRDLMPHTWDYGGVQTTLDILWCKFTQCEDLKELLLSTDGFTLVSQEPEQELLGPCLMVIRDSIKRQYTSVFRLSGFEEKYDQIIWLYQSGVEVNGSVYRLSEFNEVWTLSESVGSFVKNESIGRNPITLLKQRGLIKEDKL